MPVPIAHEPPSSRIRLRQNRACPDPPAGRIVPVPIRPPQRQARAESCLSQFGATQNRACPSSRPVSVRPPHLADSSAFVLPATAPGARRIVPVPIRRQFGEARAESCLSQFPCPNSLVPIPCQFPAVPVPAVGGLSQFAVPALLPVPVYARPPHVADSSAFVLPATAPGARRIVPVPVRATRHSARRAQNRARRAPNRACPSSRPVRGPRIVPVPVRSVPVRGPSQFAVQVPAVGGLSQFAVPALLPVPVYGPGLRVPVYASRFARHLRSWFAPGPPALAGCRRAAKPAGVTGLKFPHTVPIGRFAT